MSLVVSWEFIAGDLVKFYVFFESIPDIYFRSSVVVSKKEKRALVGFITLFVPHRTEFGVFWKTFHPVLNIMSINVYQSV